jgi:hypothetical protein
MKETRMVTLEIPAELRQLLLELRMVSQVSAARPGSSRSSDQEIGGKCPPGGLDYEGDREIDYLAKSPDYFVRRLQQPNVDLERLTDEPSKALNAYKRRPALTGEPEWGTSEWKRFVAESELSSAELARKYNCSTTWIYKVRRDYGVKDHA